MKLQSLRPRLAVLNTARVATLEANPFATPRLRGSAYMARKARWLRKHPLCVHCKAEGRTNAIDLEVDHIVELADGGADDESNFQTLCKAHHAAKTARWLALRAGR